jgi:hypothetical protein
MLKAFRFLSVLAILVLPAAMRAQVDIAGTQHVLTIHGTIAADEKGAQKIGYDAVSIGFVGAPPDAVRWLGVVSAFAYDGDTPNLLAAGKSDLVTKLRNAPTGSRVVVNGIIDQTARMFYLGSVRVTPASGSP